MNRGKKWMRIATNRSKRLFYINVVAAIWMFIFLVEMEDILTVSGFLKIIALVVFVIAAESNFRDFSYEKEKFEAIWKDSL